MNEDATIKSCPRCGSPIPADAPQGLCPKCVLGGVATSTEAGQPPIVLTSAYLIGPQASARQFDLCYDDYRNRIQKVYGCSESALKG